MGFQKHRKIIIWALTTVLLNLLLFTAPAGAVVAASFGGTDFTHSIAITDSSNHTSTLPSAAKSQDHKTISQDCEEADNCFSCIQIQFAIHSQPLQDNDLSEALTNSLSPRFSTIILSLLLRPPILLHS